MKSALVISSLAVAAAAAADPQITPRAALEPRQQNSDPAFLGWVSASQMCKLCPHPHSYDMDVPLMYL
jgi:hypothetical protein